VNAMKMGVKEMKKEFKHINIDQIEDLQVIIFMAFLLLSSHDWHLTTNSKCLVAQLQDFLLLGDWGFILGKQNVNSFSG
jgi:hypothetical protein